MIVLEFRQGSPEWLAARPRYFCASDAPAMMGASKNTTRSELLHAKATGDTKQFSAWEQEHLLDKGHAIEAAARPMVEALLGEDLYPVTGTDDASVFLASFDGITMDGLTGWENKMWNETLAAAVRAGEVPATHYWQLEHQILVGGLERVIFTVTDGTPEKFVHCEYRAVHGRVEQLRGGWRQFAEDVANYKAPEYIPAAVAAPVMALPALSVKVEGAITVVDNLKVFGEQLNAFVERIDFAPDDDQGFADAEKAVKVLQEAQEALQAAEAMALAQTASIDELQRTVAMYVETARTNRLKLEKVVEAQKKIVRTNIMQSGKDRLAEHIAALNTRLGKPYMPTIEADFAGAMKGKRTIASLRDAVDTLLANKKIESSAIADRIDINLKTLRELATDHAFLFGDTGTIVLKAPEDLTTLVKLRIAEHEAEQEKKRAAERERIRLEEEAKAQAKAKAEAERLAEQERERVRAEERAKAQAEAQQNAAAQAAKAATPGTVAPATKPDAVAPIAAPEEQRQGQVASTAPVPAPETVRSQVASALAGSPQVRGTNHAATRIPVGATRPSDDEIITTLVQHYRVHESKVIEWLLAMDLQAASDRMASEFQA